MPPVPTPSDNGDLEWSRPPDMYPWLFFTVAIEWCQLCVGVGTRSQEGKRSFKIVETRDPRTRRRLSASRTGLRHNYVMWSEDMRSFLKGHCLWCYVTCEIQTLVRSKDEYDTKFTDCLEDWDCKNHQIITWFRHSTVPTIHQQFGRYDNAKDVPLSTLKFSMSQLLSHETRLRTLQPLHPDSVLATSARPSHPSSSRNGPKYCKHCHMQGHLLSECPTIQCRYCHKIGHIIYNCPTKPPKLGQSGILPRLVNHSVVAVADESPSLSLIYFG
uniref:CCHC-type domain-containing protein n=1 Tax=Fagus sylvatica TaxID=28930 RepID=A0A2N9F7I5_FAGSY